MKKQLIIAAAIITSSLSIQGMFVSKIRTIANATKSAPARTRTYTATPKISSSEDFQSGIHQIGEKTNALRRKYGAGLGWYLDATLPAVGPKEVPLMCEYLDMVGAYASVNAEGVPSFDQYAHFKKTQQEKE